MSEPRTLVRATGSMGLATLASRVLGLLREIVFAAFLGQTLAASAFFFAFTIPNLFRRLLGEGALTTAFIPVFSATLSQQGHEAGRRAANVVASALLVACSAMTLAVIGGIALARAALPLAPSAQLILSLTQWMMPYMIFVCLAALAMAVLNTRGHFFVPAFSPVLLNLVMIGSVFVLCPWFENGVYGLALGVLIGGVLQWAYQLPLLWRDGFGYQWIFRPRDPVVSRVTRLMLPSVVGVAVFQVNVITSGALAFLVGDYARAALNYADRLMELPMGIFGVSVATYALPALSALHAQGRREEFKTSLGDALRLLWFVTVPAAVGLMLLREPIVRLLFERGRFDAQATFHAGRALLWLAPGLVAYATVNVLARAFYAMQDTKTPMKAAVAAMMANVGLAALLLGPLAEGGLALANTLSSTMNALLLSVALRRRIGPFGGPALRGSALRTLVATAAMGVASALAGYALQGLAHPLRNRVTSVVAPIAVGVLVFVVTALVLRAPELRHVSDAWRPRRRTSTPQ